MKKILSIAAISVFSTVALSVGAKAEEFKTFSFDDIVSKLKENSICENFDFQNALGDISDNKFIQELLKNCECKIFGNCIPEQNIPEIEIPTPPTECPKPEVDTPKPPVMDDENGNENNGNNNGENEDVIIPDDEITDDDIIIDAPNKPTVPENNGNGNSGNQNNSQGSLSAFESEILALVNKERASVGLSPVTASNSKLNSAAAQRAKEQATQFSHTRPNGQSWTTVLSEYGVNYQRAGENVAYGQSSPKEVMNAWMNSQGHRENILGAGYSEVGIGVYQKNGTYYWSQLFIG